MPRKKCDKPWLLVDRKSGVVLRRERHKHELSDLPTATYQLIRLPKGHYVSKRYQIEAIPEGWERRANCKDMWPADEIQPRRAARVHWARTHGHMTRFRKYED